MHIVLHETPEAYEREYQQVRGTLISQGTSLNAWLAARGISRQVAYRALTGKMHGRRSYEIRSRILREVLTIER